MPSLMPGTAGAKEAYGIAVIRDDASIAIPPKAMKRYELEDGDFVLLVTARRGEGGVGILNKKKAGESVFKKYISLINKTDTVFWFKNKAYVITKINDGRVTLSDEMLQAFNLFKNDRLLIVKSTTVTISYSPIEIWKKKLEKHGFWQAIQNMEKLEIF